MYTCSQPNKHIIISPTWLLEVMQLRLGRLGVVNSDGAAKDLRLVLCMRH